MTSGRLSGSAKGSCACEKRLRNGACRAEADLFDTRQDGSTT